MKRPAPFFLLTGLAASLLAGCGHLDLTPAGDPSRVLAGKVEISGGVILPPDAVVVVRVVDAFRTMEKPPTAILGEPSTPAPPMSQPPNVLGEQTIKSPGQPPIPFRIEYTAVDEQLRRGLNVEARISYGGRVQFYNINSYSVNLNNVADPQVVEVNRAER